MKSVAWVSSWDRACGIADYSKALFPAVKAAPRNPLDIHLLSLDEFPDLPSLMRELSRLKPDLIHFQHEYEFYGGKNPPKYWFPKLQAELRNSAPGTKLLATAHTVLRPDYRFPVKGRGFQAPVRWCANQFLGSWLRGYWGAKTWGSLDGVIVHSRRQIPAIQAAGNRSVAEIPQLVPPAPAAGRWKLKSSGNQPVVLVFGFITAEKGQDVAISALSKLPGDIRLILAGGLRTEKEATYQKALTAAIQAHRLESRVQLTGFVPPERISEYYEQADLVLAPFRETTGSASLAQALSRGAPILASDLPLNLEINERVPGTLAYFRSEDPDDCAHAISRILASPEEQKRLSQNALEYADRFSADRIALIHLDLYGKLLNENS